MASPPDYHKYIIRQFMLNFKTKVGFLGTKIAIKKWYELRPTGSAGRIKKRSRRAGAQQLRSRY